MRQHAVSPITRRILAINVLALAILVAGLLYLDEYRRGLIAAELAALRTQAQMFGVALAEGAVQGERPEAQKLLLDTANQMVRRMVETTGARARLFNPDGHLVADSRLLYLRGLVQRETLPPPGPTVDALLGGLFELYDRLARHLSVRHDLPVYVEYQEQLAEHYTEIERALHGEETGVVRRSTPEGLVLSVAVPVQRFKRVLGALMLSKDSDDLDAALLEVRRNILGVFLMALGVTVLLSFYLAGTIARPLRHLAEAAERVRRDRHRRYAIPDFGGRDDEIGELAVSLRDMTESLWQRMDATERFAADVAHEIKNPLSSLRSAVETATRIEDPERQRKLMAVIEDDVRRLDRLITDISSASKLDAELSRADTAPVDLSRMLATLADIHGTTSDEGAPGLVLTDGDGALVVDGVEGRLVQVFRNLIANAVSFSPPGSPIGVAMGRDGNEAVIAIEDEGPGIPKGKEEAIFERFYSERPESEKFGTHSGLGLSISRQIIEAHGGSLVGENRFPAKGARFTVRLPLVPAGGNGGA